MKFSRVLVAAASLFLIIVILAPGHVQYDTGLFQAASYKAATAGAPAVYPIPAQVQPLVAAVGIDPNILDHVQIKVMPDASACSGGDAAVASACFIAPNTIIMPETLLAKDPLYAETSLSHEYLHYIWSLTPQSEKDQLTPYINQAYQNAKPYLDYRLSGYVLTPDERTNELHSYIGTEIGTNLIPQPLLDHYLK